MAFLKLTLIHLVQSGCLEAGWFAYQTHFNGGKLVVRHHKQEIKYDWSSDASSMLHWAAFFSDIEYEVTCE